MERDQKGVLWEHEFRQFILKTVKHYNLTKPLTSLKRELEQRDQKWPEEAFAAHQGRCLQSLYRRRLTQRGDLIRFFLGTPRIQPSLFY